MFVLKEQLPGNWPEKLLKSNEKEVINILMLVEACLKDVSEYKDIFISLINHDNFRVKFRTFIAMKRINDTSLWPYLIEYIDQEKSTYWRLMSLEVLEGFDDKRIIDALINFLSDSDLIFLRGLIVLLGQKGPDSLPLLVDLASSDISRSIKDEIWIEVFYFACGGSWDFLETYKKTNADFDRFMRYQILPKKVVKKYDIYPYHDYLWQKARKVGINKNEYKTFFYRARNKDSKILDDNTI